MGSRRECRQGEIWSGTAPTGDHTRSWSKVIADEQTNSLIIVGTDDSYAKLLDLLKRLDSHSTDGGRVHVLPLQHAIADELAPTLSQMLGSSGGGGGKGQAAAAAAGNAGGMFEGEVRITPDKSTNSLIITSSNRDYATLRLVLDKLDRPRRHPHLRLLSGARPVVGDQHPRLAGRMESRRPLHAAARAAGRAGAARGVRRHAARGARRPARRSGR